MVELQDITKKNDLNYQSKLSKTDNFGKYWLSIVFNGYKWWIITIKKCWP